MRNLLALSVLVAASFSFDLEAAERPGTVSFGFANESIVPNRPVAIGGQYHTRISGAVNDPISVTAVAMETSDERGKIQQVVWVSCDLCAIRKRSVQNVRKLVADLVPDLDPEKIIVSATHTHTAPALSDTRETNLHPYDFLGSWAYRVPQNDPNLMQPLEYLDYLERQIASAVVSAWQSRKPGEISSMLSHASIARNRRAVYFDGTTRMYGDTKDPNFSHLEGTTDDSVDVLFFWREARPVGMMITLYCPSQEVEGEVYLSADFWNEARALLRDQYSSNLFVVGLTGAAGDQSPHVQIDKAAEGKMLQRRGGEYRYEIARRLVRAVDDVIELGRKERTSQVVLDHRVEQVRLPVWKVPDERFASSQALVEAGKDKLDQLSGLDYINWRVSRTMMARYEHQKTEPYYAPEIHALRINDLAMATNPFELYTDYGLRMKARSPALQTSIVQLTAECGAYLPTERAVQGGGYSGRIDDGVVGPEGGRVLVEETVRMLRSMWDQ